MAVKPAPPTVEPVLETVPAPRKPSPKSYQPLTTRLVPRPGTVLVFLLGLWIKRSTRRVRLPEVLKWWLLILATANWRSAPGYWSATVTSVIPEVWARFLIKGRAAVLKNVIGKSPFEAVSYTEHIASFNFCDFVLHLSNSSYAYALDRARLRWHVNFLGAPMRRDFEHVRWMVAATQFTFFNEIPMLATYRVETRLASWDHKWAYLVHVFSTAPPKGSRERVVNCIALTRIVYKLGRRTVRPSRVFALSGFGPDGSNFERTVRLRSSAPKGSWKGKQGREWLLGPESQDGFEVYEERRAVNLEVVRTSLDGTDGAESLKTL